MNPKPTKRPKTKSDKAFERLLMIIGIALLIVFLLGALAGAGINNAIRNKDTAEANEPGVLTVAATQEPTEKPELWIDLGPFTCVAYDACTDCCGKTDGITKTGTKATAGRTVAVDPEVIPLGSTLLIDGQEYIAEDIGGAIKGNKIDIFHNSHAEALEYGKQTHTVQIKAE